MIFIFAEASHCLNFDTFRDTAPLKSSQEISRPMQSHPPRQKKIESYIFDKSFEIIVS